MGHLFSTTVYETLTGKPAKTEELFNLEFDFSKTDVNFFKFAEAMLRFSFHLLQHQQMRKSVFISIQTVLDAEKKSSGAPAQKVIERSQSPLLVEIPSGAKMAAGSTLTHRRTLTMDRTQPG